MIVTLTEMGEKKYVVYFQRGSQRRRGILTTGMRDALRTRGRRLWATKDFGRGQLGQQAQYEVIRQPGSRWEGR